MNEPLLRAFLDDIKSNPQDPAPRLILADWLDEQATTEEEHARAALLRLGVAEQETPAPLNRLISQEARSIWNRFQRTWTAPIQHTSGLRATCIQGLIHLEVTVSGWMSRALRLFAESPDWLWVNSLTVTGRDQRLNRVWARPWLQTISRLRLRCGRGFLADRWGNLFDSPNLGALRELELQGQVHSTQTLSALSRWPGLARLRVLGLANNSFTPGILRPLLSSRLPSDLRRLDLAGCVMDEETFSAISQSPRFAGLEELHLAQNSLSAGALATLGQAPLAASLRTLVLNQNPLGNDGIQNLVVAPLPHLRSLGLIGVQMGASGADFLSQAPFLSRLEVLDASSNLLQTGGVALLRASLPALCSLSLRNVHLPEQASSALAEANWNQLRCLDLANNPSIGNIVSAITRNPALTHLRWLDLSHCQISDSEAVNLACWPVLSRLEMLGLEYNALHDDGLRALVTHPGYRTSAIWRLYGNQVSPALRQEIRNLPHPVAL